MEIDRGQAQAQSAGRKERPLRLQAAMR